MWAHITTGTTQFLLQMIERYPDIDFRVMRRASSTLVYYESKRKKSIFVSGRTYEILYEHRALKKRGFVVINTIPITSDGVDSFQHRAEQTVPKLEFIQGVQAVRLLKQRKKNTFVLLTQWDNEAMYNLWQASTDYKTTNLFDFARLPAYFAERPHTATYYMLVDDEDEDEATNEE